MSVVDVLQVALAIEHQAIYGYGVIGARLDMTRATPVVRPVVVPADVQVRLTAHKVLRDRLIELLKSRGATPVAAAVAYALPFRIKAPGTAAKLGEQLEMSTANAAWDVIAASSADSAERRVFVAALMDAAHWQDAWARELLANEGSDAEPRLTAFPGQPAATQPSTTPTSSPS